VTTKKTLEHNQPAPAKAGLIKTADWTIDLGPEGGVNGGEIVATGTPEAVAKEPRSFTGAYLAPLLERGRRVSAGVENEAVAAE
jgi:excinuclease ABC subunit A